MAVVLNYDKSLEVPVNVHRGVRSSCLHRRNHHTMIKNQKTKTRKMMYHNHRQPCRSAMLFIRRKAPARIPDVSANASF